MTNPELIVAIIATLGGGAALPELIRGVVKWANGKQARERDALHQADADLKAADAQYAAARQERAYWMDAYYRLRAHAVASGIALPDDPPTTIIEPPRSTQ